MLEHIIRAIESRRIYLKNIHTQLIINLTNFNPLTAHF